MLYPDICMLCKLDPQIIDALQIVVQKLKSTKIKWVLAGSVSLALQGVEVESKDADILTDRQGAYRIAELLKKHEVKPIRLRADKMFRSYLGEFEIKGVKVEVMGDLEERIGSKWVSLSGRLDSPKLLKVDGMKMPVSSLEEQLKSYGVSRRKKDKIRSQKIKEAIKSPRSDIGSPQLKNYKTEA